MDILYYNCFAGISGDMNLAAMLDLGVPIEHLKNELQKLNLTGYNLSISTGLKMGISGTKVEVKTDVHGHSNHTHNHKHEHRSFKKIKEIINNSNLNSKIKSTSIDIFKTLAIAEGKIHNIPVEEVHFHEVGAIDSIVDIVGAAVCYHFLSPKYVYCSTIELGGGFVNCAHGRLPVPAPATTEILKNIPTKIGTVKHETTTPTGAAILATLVDTFLDTPEFTISKIGYGIGHKDFEIPNVLRVFSASTNSKEPGDIVCIIECNIDDMSSERFGYLMDELFDNGAHDVFFTPIIMKKSRPATKINVLCNTSDESKLGNIILHESTSIGYRSYTAKKTKLNRKLLNINTRYGDIDIKVSYGPGIPKKMKPEYEQCKEAAKKHNISLAEIIKEVENCYNQQKND